MQALSQRPERVLVVHSVGERALASAERADTTVLCASPAQRAVLELKLACSALPWAEHLQVMGLLTDGRRVSLLHRVLGALTPASRAWWRQNERLVRLGLLRSGALEQRLDTLRGALLKVAPNAASRWPRRRGWSWCQVVQAAVPQVAAGLESRLKAPRSGAPEDLAQRHWLLSHPLPVAEAWTDCLSPERHARLAELAARLTLVDSAEQLEGRRFDAVDLGVLGPRTRGLLPLLDHHATLSGYGQDAASASIGPPSLLAGTRRLV